MPFYRSVCENPANTVYLKRYSTPFIWMCAHSKACVPAAVANNLTTTKLCHMEHICNIIVSITQLNPSVWRSNEVFLEASLLLLLLLHSLRIRCMMTRLPAHWTLCYLRYKSYALMSGRVSNKIVIVVIGVMSIFRCIHSDYWRYFTIVGAPFRSTGNHLEENSVYNVLNMYLFDPSVKRKKLHFALIWLVLITSLAVNARAPHTR